MNAPKKNKRQLPGEELFSVWKRDPSVKRFNMRNTGFMKFETRDGLHGLARRRAGALELLAIIAFTPGRGAFRSFMTKAKAIFPVIYVWEVKGREMPAILLRYGFEPHVMDDGSERLVGFRWARGKDTTL